LRVPQRGKLSIKRARLQLTEINFLGRNRRIHASRSAFGPPHWRPIALRTLGQRTNGNKMPDRQPIYAKVVEMIEPFNKKGVAITEATRFAQDLEWDSLTVLDFVANIEDEFDVLISMNMQAEIETVGQLVDALQRLQGGK